MRKSNCKPYWRTAKQAWYCTIEGRQKSLGKDEKEARARYRKLLRQKAALGGLDANWTVRRCLDHYLENASRFKANTLRNRQQLFDRFCSEAKVGKLRITDLTADHLEAWVAAHPGWSPSSRRTAINSIMAAINYCVKRKKIRENPISGVVRPKWERRKAVIGKDDERAVYDASRGAFRAILTALRETGARPGELCKARVEDYRDGMIVLTEHKEDRHVETRTIHLTPSLREEVERLIGGRTTGPIWTNSRGKPWKPDTIYCRFKRARKDLGLGDGVFPYSLRHNFASDAINESDANPAVVAKLLGHSGMETLMRFYFREDPEAAQKALAEIRKGRKRDG